MNWFRGLGYSNANSYMERELVESETTKSP